jgi:hypothetical protein
MAWLGEELPEKEQDGRTPFPPRCLKDVVEERLFAQRAEHPFHCRRARLRFRALFRPAGSG